MTESYRSWLLLKRWPLLCQPMLDEWNSVVQDISLARMWTMSGASSSRQRERHELCPPRGPRGCGLETRSILSMCKTELTVPKNEPRNERLISIRESVARAARLTEHQYNGDWE